MTGACSFRFYGAGILLESFDSDTQADVLVLDFSKAFDTVPHRKLLSKLEAYGIHGPILHWIENFLTQRKMSVVVEGESSHEVDVESEASSIIRALSGARFTDARLYTL